MAQPVNTPPLGAAGLTNTSLLSGRDDSKYKRPKLKNQAGCPIVIATNCRMTADLLAESIEIAMACSLGILSAAREADDAAILHQFVGFDAAARSARQCAEELRSALHLLDSEGSQ